MNVIRSLMDHIKGWQWAELKWGHAMTHSYKIKFTIELTIVNLKILTQVDFQVLIVPNQSNSIFL